MKTAKVYLVGAGPGDPDLITVKGKACIEAADVIIYDYLAAPALLNHARETAEIIYVGKQAGDHTLSQDEINALLVEKCKSGATNHERYHQFWESDSLIKNAWHTV